MGGARNTHRRDKKYFKMVWKERNHKNFPKVPEYFSGVPVTTSQ
jgi:hypothetical protein